MLGFVLMWSACKSSKTTCEEKPPEAIFSADMPKVSAYEMTQQGHYLIEQMDFTGGIRLQLTQGGCNQYSQEYQFKLTGDFKNRDADFWKEKANECLELMGSANTKLQLMTTQFVEALRQNQEYIYLGQAFEIGPNFFIEIDRIVSTGYALLTIEMKQGEATGG